MRFTPLVAAFLACEVGVVSGRPGPPGPPAPAPPAPASPAPAPPGLPDLPTPGNPRGIKFIFAFGDSYSDRSFVFNGTLPTVGNQLGNPPYPGFVSSHGPNWLDFLTVNFTNPEVLTFDLARNGAVTTNTLCTPFIPTVLDLSLQISQEFIPNLASRPAFAPWTSRNALFIIAMGVNDVLCTSGAPNATALANKTSAILDFTFSGVQTLFDAGARNFLFWGSPAVSLTPLKTAAGAAAVTAQDAADVEYVRQLRVRSAQFGATHPGFRGDVFDVGPIFKFVSANPAIFGLKDTANFCAAYATGGSEDIEANDPSCAFPVRQFFWKDNLHPTFIVHQEAARQMGAFLGFPPRPRVILG